MVCELQQVVLAQAANSTGPFEMYKRANHENDKPITIGLEIRS